jgi:hypothetical protein
MTAVAARVRPPLATLVGTTIDQLVNLDVSGYGVIGALYRAATERQGAPLTLMAAERLLDVVGPGDYVFLTGGWILPGYLAYGENDGPLGCAVLARALWRGCQAKPLVLTEERLVPNFAATCRAAGLLTYGPEDLERLDPSRVPGLAVLPFPLDDAEARIRSKELLARFRPKVLLSVEKNGPNKAGVYHMVGGTDNSGEVAKVARLFEAAREAGVLTIGIGDRGNEIGFAVINDVVAALLPYGATCRCPCGQGVADDTRVDLLVTACVSNWGAYGIAACLAELRGNLEILHTAADEARLIRECARAGGYDGMSGEPVFAVDGMRGEISVAIVEILREVVRAPASRSPSKFSTPLYATRTTP